MTGNVAITFNSYLMRLRQIERSKPESIRRHVPSIAEISRIAGLKNTTGSRLMHGHVSAVSLEKLSLVLNTMNDLGFNTNITDFFTYTRYEKGE